MASLSSFFLIGLRFLLLGAPLFVGLLWWLSIGHFDSSKTVKKWAEVGLHQEEKHTLIHLLITQSHMATGNVRRLFRGMAYLLHFGTKI